MDDSKSRGRHSSYSKDRQQQIVTFFVVGLCAGIIISQRLYIHNTRAELQSHGTAIRTGQQASGSTAASTAAAKSVDRKFMRSSGSISSALKAPSGGSATLSTAAVAGALAAEVAAAEAAAVAAISEELVRVDPQLRELEAYLRKASSGS